MTDQEKQQVFEKLKREKEKLSRKIETLKELTKPIPPGDEIGRVSRMDAINNKAVAEAALRTARRKLDRLQTMKSNLTAPNFIATSDERLKDNITTAPVGLIDSLKGREWDWKESGEKGSGVVAQELEEVLPHLVHTDDEGMKSVSYMGLCAYLIEEVKALRAEVEALKS